MGPKQGVAEKLHPAGILAIELLLGQMPQRAAWRKGS